jgi:hypothetical protein
MRCSAGETDKTKAAIDSAYVAARSSAMIFGWIVGLSIVIARKKRAIQ